MGIQVAGFERAVDGVFHVLAGGQCRPLPLEGEAGVWPADPGSLEPALALVGGTVTEAMRPALVGRTTVRGRPAVVVAYGGYPASGTVHGGHQAVLWNEGGAGHAVSAHFAPRVGRARRLAVLRAIAGAARPA